MWTALIAALLTGPVHPHAAVAPSRSIPVASLDDLVVVTAESEPALADFAFSPRFGTRGSRRWQAHGGFGMDVKSSRNTLGLAGLGVSYFIIDNLSLDAELNGLYVSQRGYDALAGNFNLLFRWHFLARDTWSVYAEAGAGMLLATDKVPRHGSRFNLTPQMGFGASFEIAEDTRLMTGVRWQHISNANLYSDNPGRDSIVTYIGVNFGF